MNGQASVLRFPTDLNVNWRDRFDRIYFTSFAANFILFFVLFGYMQSVPVRTLSDTEIASYMKAIYKIGSPPKPKTRKQPVVSLSAGKTIEVEKLPHLSEVDKKRLRVAKRAMRVAELIGVRNRIRKEAVFIAAGALVSNKSRGENGQRKGRANISGMKGFQSGDLSGLNLLGVEGVTLARERGWSAYTDGGEGIELTQLQLSALKRLADRPPTEFPDEVPGMNFKANQYSSRKMLEVRQVINERSGSIRSCFNQQKNRDSNLHGKITVLFTILGNGKVGKIRITDSIWSNPTLGIKVEKCLQNRVKHWRFGLAEGDMDTAFILNLI
jgi:hypothetical protein